MDAFDADVLIYAAAGVGHELGRRVLALFPDAAETGAPAVGIGSMLLLPEVLTKPLRRQADRGPGAQELGRLLALLSRIDLRSVDRPTAVLGSALGAIHGLRAVDAVHLATAVVGGAERFITNNSRHFPKSITEIDITYPTDLPDPAGG